MTQKIKFSDLGGILGMVLWLGGALCLGYARLRAPEYTVPTVFTDLCNIVQLLGLAVAVWTVISESRKSGLPSMTLFKDAQRVYRTRDTFKNWVIYALGIFAFPFLWWNLVLDFSRVTWMSGVLGISGFILSGIIVWYALLGFYNIWLYHKTTDKRLYKWTLIDVNEHRCHSCDEYKLHVSQGSIRVSSGPKGRWSSATHITICGRKCLDKQLSAYL
jgi:hypothetical protein